jgi:antitoxin component of MazEF toxin-antitoxin module
VGNSNAILLDKPLLELIGLKEDGSVEITVDHGSIIITPVSPSTVPADRAKELLDKIVATRRSALKRLAE